MIEKAGSVITRANNNGDREVYLIHRARYNDWSLPKGHIDAGESPQAAAIREALEETGFVCTIVRKLPDYEYQLPNGEHARVHFFECSVVSEDLTKKDTESDRGQWMTISDACECISYPSQRMYLLLEFDILKLRTHHFF